MTRRQFLKYAIGAIGGVLSAAVVSPVIRYFLAPATESQTARWIAIASTSEVDLGKPTHILYEERVRDSWAVTTRSKTAWVVTQDGQIFTVFDPRCTHLGCPYFWQEDQKRFLCPCHNGIFDINGNVISGPPPRPLDRLPNKVEDGIILVREGP
ncbi:ubiquinol-cytochrome c reductase iron-sulfur subunit [Chloroflexota bacterium]